MRKKDLIWISVFSGALGVILLITIIALFIPGAIDPDEDWIELFSNFYTFRFLLMIVLTLVFTGIDVIILRSYRVNYQFIFELDPRYKVTHI